MNVTSFEEEQEAYILTSEEEESALSHALEMAKKHYAWKLRDKGLNTQAEIDFKISQVNFIDLINRIEVLKRANSNKHQQQWQDEQNIKRKLEAIKKEEEVKSLWTARAMLKLIRWTSQIDYNQTLIENEQTLPWIKALCFFLSEDERFETELGYSLKKGIIIRGNCGLGKTFVAKCAAKNDRNPIYLLSMIEIADEIKHNGEFELDINRRGKIYIDDVGSESSVVNHFGTKINWFKDFIETFYMRSTQYNKLIFSTNINLSAIEDLYGFRLRSRLRDMFNLIDIDGKDLRG